MEIPHEFLASKLELPTQGSYAAGILFVRGSYLESTTIIKLIAQIAGEYGYNILNRLLPVDRSVLGPIARESEPLSIQLFFIPNKKTINEAELIGLKYRINHRLSGRWSDVAKLISLSTTTIPYKAMVTPKDLSRYHLDLTEPALKSRFALVHTRFSTNTLPKWDLIQPFSRSCHNGEFNTLRGNLNWFANDATDQLVRDKLNLKDVLDTAASDSCLFDHVVEWHVKSGTPLPEVVRTMIPPAVNTITDPGVGTFYRGLSAHSESWEGPALVAFADGKNIGAVADRSGLRPARYILRCDGWFYLGSESGACPMESGLVAKQSRLGAGEMIAVDLDEGKVTLNAQINRQLADLAPSTKIAALEIEAGIILKPREHLSAIAATQLVSEEEINHVLKPMAANGKEPTGSMGRDFPLAVLSKTPSVCYDFFHQKFAQVTNPPLDAIREKNVTSLSVFVGSKDSFYAHLPNPMTTPDELVALEKQFGTIGIDLEIPDQSTIQEVLQDVQRQVEQVARSKSFSVIRLQQSWTDGPLRPKVPTIFALSYVHQQLVAQGLRRRVAIICDVDDARSVHHMAVLVGFGADLIFPRLGYEIAQTHGSVEHYREALADGLLKIMSKMGIATVQSYRGAQIFDVIGFGDDVMAMVFPQKKQFTNGHDFDLIAQETRARYNQPHLMPYELDPGLFRWTPEGAKRQHSPNAIALLQKAVRLNDSEAFASYCEEVDGLSKSIHLRGGVEIAGNRDFHSLVAADNEYDVLKRLVTGAMSIGSISPEAHEAIAVASNQLGVRSNSGEGGEDPRRDKVTHDGTLKQSAIRQIASGRFGVTADYLVNAQEIQIKVCQGAKPGEGGHLPGAKVDSYIAKLRHTVPGIPLISPPPHHDIYSIEDLAQLIADLKELNPSARISVKLVASSGVDVVAVGVAKAGADTIVISGFDGGTGASPVSSIHHAGLPFELGLWSVHRLLVKSGLRDRVRLQVDGGLRTPKDVVLATVLGADEFGFGSVTLIALGCVMMRQCHHNTCPVGIATQDPELRELFPGEPEHLVGFFKFMARGVLSQIAKLGYRKLDELRGRIELLETVHEGTINFVDYLEPLEEPSFRPVERTAVLPRDQQMIKHALTALRSGRKFKLSRQIISVERSFGTKLTGVLIRELKDHFTAAELRGHVQLNLFGHAGPSFMAFANGMIRTHLVGDANDFLGKGLSGADISVSTNSQMRPLLAPEIVGNVCLYGATSGQLYVAGGAGERFAVRNSGAISVVESVGNCACEYMTGGAIAILDEIGDNFGAGMSGGAAFVNGKAKDIADKLNEGVIGISLTRADALFLEKMISRHYSRTQSELALSLLNCPDTWDQFTLVLHPDYADKWVEEREKLERTYFETFKSRHKGAHGLSHRKKTERTDRSANVSY